MNNEYIVETKGLNKSFGTTKALNDVNIQLGRGNIIGLLGSNGSGKSTLLRHMIGLYIQDSGDCHTLGVPANALEPQDLARIGYVHQEGELQDWMKVSQMINYVSCYYPTWNQELCDNLVQKLSLSLDARIAKLSPGQRQKLSILLAICHEPELLILDEPAAGMDPIARMDFLALLMDIIQDSNRTIIISSHILSDIEKVIDHVLMMHEGKMIHDCSFDDLREYYYKVKVSLLNGEFPDEFQGDSLEMLEVQKSSQEAWLTVKDMNQAGISELENSYTHCQFSVSSLPLEEIYKLVMVKVK
ncbi:MAG: ABC transporter ATP-binding protein [Planctomycetes bacterium]|nr:ABC transporter ATP-binding protein [Planctomycetota bacterium]